MEEKKFDPLPVYRIYPYCINPYLDVVQEWTYRRTEIRIKDDY